VAVEIVDLIGKALDVRAYYQRILASNIANVETPGYKEKDIDFKTALGAYTGDPSRIEVTQREDAVGIASADGNTVGMEDQIVKMTENTLVFSSLVQLITKKFSMIKYAINEGRK
jgi:flagellar basal-body rod protein FlgB